MSVLPPTQQKIMSLLKTEPGPYQVSWIVEKLQTNKGNISKHLKQLEEKGQLQTWRDPADKRKMIVDLLKEGVKNSIEIPSVETVTPIPKTQKAVKPKVDNKILQQKESKIKALNSQIKILERHLAKSDKTIENLELLLQDSEEQMKRNNHYDLVNQGQLHQIIVETIQGLIPVKIKTQKRMKKQYAVQPFGGQQAKSGGWNSITYAVFEALLKSERLYTKK